MASPFGISFVPGGQDRGNGMSRERTGALRNPVQEAIKVLSLRLPKFYGTGRGMSPDALLSGAGGMGQPGARSNPTALALAQMAGLPPMMGLPQSRAPMMPPLGGGGTDTYGGWARNERNLPGAVSSPPHITPWMPPPTDGFDNIPTRGDLPTKPGAPTDPLPAPGNPYPSGNWPDWPVPRPDDWPGTPPQPEPGPWTPAPPPRVTPGGDPIDLSRPSQEPTSTLPPFERPGGNPLAQKYLDMLDQFGGGGY